MSPRSTQNIILLLLLVTFKNNGKNSLLKNPHTFAAEYRGINLEMIRKLSYLYLAFIVLECRVQTVGSRNNINWSCPLLNSACYHINLAGKMHLLVQTTLLIGSEARSKEESFFDIENIFKIHEWGSQRPAG